MDAEKLVMSTVVMSTVYLKILKLVDFIESRVEKVMAFIAASTLIILSAIVLLQIFARLFLDTPPVWTEELSRYLFIVTISVSVGIAFKRGELVSVDLLLNFLTDKNKYIFKIIMLSITLMFSFVVLPYSIEFAQIGKFQLSPTMFFPMSYVFSCVVVLLGNLAFFVFLDLIRNVIKLLTWRKV